VIIRRGDVIKMRKREKEREMKFIKAAAKKAEKAGIKLVKVKVK